MVAVKIRGVLRHEGGRWWVDVSELRDPARRPRPAEPGRRPAAEVRPRRGRPGPAGRSSAGAAFKDAALLKRAKEIEGDAIRAESDRPPGVDPSALLARPGRARPVAETCPSPSRRRRRTGAFARRSPRQEVGRRPEGASPSRIESFFPAVEGPPARGRSTCLAGRSPTPTPRPTPTARPPPSVRQALDHRLWADATQQLLERRASESPKSLLALADEAARLLPDRPELASRFLERGSSRPRSDVGALRLSEVETLATLYREKLHQPEKARELYRAWLERPEGPPPEPPRRRGADRAWPSSTRPCSTTGPRPSRLLRDALAIDPESREVADAFRRRELPEGQGRMGRTRPVAGRPRARSRTPSRRPSRTAAVASAARRPAASPVPTRSGARPRTRSGRGWGAGRTGRSGWPARAS